MQSPRPPPSPPPPGPAAQPRCAAAAPPRACPGRRNTETLNTEDAQLRARCATQGPAPRPGAPRRPTHLRVRAACLSRPRFSQLRQRGRGLERLANIPQPPPAAWPRSGSRERKYNLGGAGENILAGAWGDVSEPQRSTRRAQRGVSCLSSGRFPGVSWTIGLPRRGQPPGKGGVAWPGRGRAPLLPRNCQ